MNNQYALPFSGPPVLACGAWLKNTVCVTQGDWAQVSALIGDLGTAAACRLLEETVAELCGQVAPALVAHDLHPDFFSTRFALDFAARHGIPALAVQHHHAHVAAVCAEHRLTGPLLGLALDGVGLGTDGAAWGGELLRVDGADCRRIGHLAYLAMPGGERAAVEPWRMAAAALSSMGRGDEIAPRFHDLPAATTVAAMLARGLNCPPTSSMGRLFDAAAGLLGVNYVQQAEAQAAIALQALAERHGPVVPLAGGWQITDSGVLDFVPLLAALADCPDAAYGAALFHATLAAGLADWVARAATEQQLNRVALGGGCFYNGLLTDSLTELLAAQGLQVYTSRQPGDAAISLGQAWVALHHLERKGN
ncbi:MAG: carbamoyltransferase HypF [Gallionella sp.]|nr:carbamoyltransferase HypF [Gallionella sp.]MDD4947694.1 carbamoyltransferase HypF [Gallionella sp.]